MRVIVTVLFFFANHFLFAQRKAEITIINALQEQDTIFIEYCVKNISDSTFIFYGAPFRDVGFSLINISLISISGAKTNKYLTSNLGDLDQLVFKEKDCSMLRPGDSVLIKYSLEVSRFKGRLSAAKRKKIALEIYYPTYLLQCHNCSNNLLSEVMYSEREVVLK